MENLFDLSFIVKDGMARVVVDPDTMVPYVGTSRGMVPFSSELVVMLCWVVLQSLWAPFCGLIPRWFIPHYGSPPFLPSPLFLFCHHWYQRAVRTHPLHRHPHRHRYLYTEHVIDPPVMESENQVSSTLHV